jgi:hypothetical protein
MKRAALAGLLVCMVFGALGLAAQDKEKTAGSGNSAEAPKSVTPLRVQVVFNEYDGDKKISSLPYTLLVNADSGGPQAAVRMGLRVPIEVSGGGPNVNKQFQYQDLGIDLDGTANSTDNGRFLLRLNVEKSSAYAPGSGQKPGSLEGNEIVGGQPIIQRFRSQINLLARDGQTIQSTVATDPVTGHVLKVDVTLNVIK